jgi:hypothetical protein
MSSAKYRTVDFKAKNNDGPVVFSGINQIDVKNDNLGDYHFITFVLDDKTSPSIGLRFRPLSADPNLAPFWIQPIEQGCPQAAATLPAVAEPWFVSPDGKELTIIDYNGAVQQMRFALRMVDSAGNGHDYDPIMNNQNGGGGGISLADAATFTFAVASVGVILYESMGGMS